MSDTNSELLNEGSPMLNQIKSADSIVSNKTIQTGGGTSVGGGVNTGGDFIGRDSNTIIFQSTERKTIFSEDETPRQIKENGETYVKRVEKESELEKKLFKESQNGQIVCVHGLFGTGKLSLVSEVVNRENINEKYADGTLFVDLSNSGMSGHLHRLILPFEPNLKFDPKLSVYDYFQKARSVLESKKVLIVVKGAESEDQLKNFFFNLKEVTLLFIVNHKFRAFNRDAEFVELLEMTESEAIEMFKRHLKDYVSSQQYDENVLRSLVHELHFVPAKIELAADMILLKNYDPEEFLNEFVESKQEHNIGESEWYNFNYYLEKIFNLLPEDSQKVLPYFGIFGKGQISVSAISAVSRHSRELVIRAFEQMKRFDLLDEIYTSVNLHEVDNPFSVKDRVRAFAATKLRDMLGEDADITIDVLKASMANYFLAEGAEKLAENRWEFVESYRLSDSIDYNQAFGKEIPTYKYVDSVFDHMLINYENAREVWADLFIKNEIKHLRTHLDEAFRWAIEHEDWELLRRFFKVNLRGAYQFSEEGIEEKEARRFALDLVQGSIKEHTYSRRRFVHIHNFDLTNKKIYGLDLKAVRLLGSKISGVSFISGRCLGIQIQQADWQNVILVGLEAPALHILNSTWSEVDVRMADFRGAIFENCRFENVDFRGSQLTGATFYDCTLLDCDFRRKSENNNVYISEKTSKDSQGIKGL